MKTSFNTNIKIILLLFALFFIFVDTSQADNKGRGFLIPSDSSAYDIYSYPEGDAKFSIPQGFKVKFTAKNGKYFYIQSEDVIGNHECNFDIWFFTSDGEKINKVNVKHLAESYEIPQNEKSITAEYIEIIIINKSKKIARNFDFVIASDRDSVHGELLKENI